MSPVHPNGDDRGAKSAASLGLPDSAASGGSHDSAASADAQERRALQALESILAGGDLGDETLRLANEFTDRHTARFTAWVRRLGAALRQP